jgi:hypothetical protein
MIKTRNNPNTQKLKVLEKEKKEEEIRKIEEI